MHNELQLADKAMGDNNSLFNGTDIKEEPGKSRSTINEGNNQINTNFIMAGLMNCYISHPEEKKR